MGVAKEEGESGDNLFQLVECVHAPYCQLLVRYSVTMETNTLKHKLHNVNLVSVWRICVRVCMHVCVCVSVCFTAVPGGRDGGRGGPAECVHSLGLPVCL